MLRLRSLILIPWLLITACEGQPTPAAPTTEDGGKASVEYRVMNSDLGRPWGMAFLPDGDLLITEKSGQLLRMNPDTGDILERIGNLPESEVQGQGGMLDVAVDPSPGEYPWIYLSYAAPGEGGHSTEVSRGQLRQGQLQSLQRLFVAEPKSGSGQHFGSRLVFDRDGYLFITLGDRGDRDEAQNLASHTGSVIRLHRDGRVPADNPFVGQADARPEIYSYGHRNIQGAAMHPVTGRIWIHEHGPQGGDEINILEKGANYGWPLVTYGREYGTGLKIGEEEAPGFFAPAWQWTPSIAPSGMAFYSEQDALQSPYGITAWSGHLLIGALKYQMLVTMKAELPLAESERLFVRTLGRIRDVEVDDRGQVWLLIDDDPGQLIRVRGMP